MGCGGAEAMRILFFYLGIIVNYGKKYLLMQIFLISPCGASQVGRFFFFLARSRSPDGPAERKPWFFYLGM